jgi:hypothetical protein
MHQCCEPRPVGKASEVRKSIETQIVGGIVIEISRRDARGEKEYRSIRQIQ